MNSSKNVNTLKVFLKILFEVPRTLDYVVQCALLQFLMQRNNERRQVFLLYNNMIASTHSYSKTFLLQSFECFLPRDLQEQSLLLTVLL